MTEKPNNDKDYYPYPTAISIHDNEYGRENTRPTGKGKLGMLFRFKLKFGKNVPHIMYDGIIDPNNLGTNGQVKADKKICIYNNKMQSFANIDAENGFKNISRNLDNYNCTLPNFKTIQDEK